MACFTFWTSRTRLHRSGFHLYLALILLLPRADVVMVHLMLIVVPFFAVDRLYMRAFTGGSAGGSMLSAFGLPTSSMPGDAPGEAGDAAGSTSARSGGGAGVPYPGMA